jgi:prepilin-type N-terminal cleavage/methylation domain-containing protein
LVNLYPMGNGSRQGFRASEQGMTLVEIMMVVLIIALLAAIAIPAFKKSRDAAQNTRFVADLRVAVSSFDQISFESLGLPPDSAPGVMPDRMSEYLTKMKWTEATPLGGQWDWSPDIAGFGNGVVVIVATEQDARMADVDKLCDDGNINTGLFQKVDTTSYAYKVE